MSRSKITRKSTSSVASRHARRRASRSPTRRCRGSRRAGSDYPSLLRSLAWLARQRGLQASAVSEDEDHMFETLSFYRLESTRRNMRYSPCRPLTIAFSRCSLRNKRLDRSCVRGSHCVFSNNLSLSPSLFCEQ